MKDYALEIKGITYQVNGKGYFDYEKDSFERINWHKIIFWHETKDKIIDLFENGEWIIPGQMLFKLPLEYKPFLDDFLIDHINNRTPKSRTQAYNIADVFLNWINDNS